MHIADCAPARGLGVRNLDLKLPLGSHDQLDGVETHATSLV
jgi:hypothetical protein